MAKHKKKHSKKKDKDKIKDKVKDVVSDDILDVAALSIRKFRKVTNEIAKLSLGQKLAGGVALLAAGLIYLDQRKGGGDEKPHAAPKFEWPRLAEAHETSATEDEDEDVAAAPATPAPSRKHRKSPKAGKPRGSGGHKPLPADELA